MATITCSAPLIRIPPNHRTSVPGPSLSFPFRNLHLRTHGISNSFNHFTLEVNENKKKEQLLRIVARSVEEETPIIPEEQEAVQEEEASSSSSSEQPPVSVPVSPSDILTMFFQVIVFIYVSNVAIRQIKWRKKKFHFFGAFDKFWNHLSTCFIIPVSYSTPIYMRRPSFGIGL